MCYPTFAHERSGEFGRRWSFPYEKCLQKDVLSIYETFCRIDLHVSFFKILQEYSVLFKVHFLRIYWLLSQLIRLRSMNVFY